MPSKRATIIAAAVLLLTHVMVIDALSGQQTGAVLSDVVQLLLGLLCVLTSTQAFRRSGSVARYYWRWLILAFSMWVVAQALGVYIDVTENHSLDVLDDLLFFCSQAPFGMLLFLDPDHESNRFDRLHLLDFLQVCAFLASVYLYFSYGAGALTSATMVGPFGWTRSFAFDAVMIASFGLRAVLADTRLVRALFVRLGIFLVCASLADSYADFAPNQLRPGHWFDLVWSILLLIPVVIAVTWNQKEASLQPPRRAQSIVINQFFPLLYPFFTLLLLAQVARTYTVLASTILVISFAAVGVRTLVIQHRLGHAQENLEFEAAHDALTGLWNHGAILEILEKEVRRHNRRGEPLGVMMVDIDFFKSINDTHGHAIGDLVLQDAAAQLSATVRSYDSVGRYGGEEFLIITPNADAASALAGAERLRQSLAGSPIATALDMIFVTISVGVVSSGKEPLRSAELLRMADQALYRAKTNGRNRVELISPAGETRNECSTLRAGG